MAPVLSRNPQRFLLCVSLGERWGLPFVEVTPANDRKVAGATQIIVDAGIKRKDGSR